MRRQAIFLAAALIMAPLGAKAADLVVWWEKGFYAQEDEAVSGDHRRLRAGDRQAGRARSNPRRTRCSTRSRRRSRPGSRPISCSALSATMRRPSGLTRTSSSTSRIALGPFAGPVRSRRARGVATLLNGRTGRRALYALPMGRRSNHLHVWNSLLERAGFTLADIPKEWEAFWSFWCDQVQPAVRQGRWAATTSGASGLPMSASGSDTDDRARCSSSSPTTRHWRRPATASSQVDDPGDSGAGMIKALDGLHRDLPQGLHAARLGELDTASTTTRRSSRRPW